MTNNVRIGMLFKVDGLLFKHRILKVINYAKCDRYVYVDVSEREFTGTIHPDRMILLDIKNNVKTFVKKTLDVKELDNKELLKLVMKKDKESIKEFVRRYKKLPNNVK